MTFASYSLLAAERLQRYEVWRVLLGLALIAIFYFAANIAVILPMLNQDELQALSAGRNVSSPKITLTLLLPFVGVALGCLLVMRLLHRSPIINLFRLRKMPFLKAFLTGMLLTAMIYGILSLLPQTGGQIEPGLTPTSWIIFLAPALALLLVQSASEELVFRGYLQSMLAARFRSPLIWWFMPSLIFGALHWQPGVFGPNTPLVVLSAVLLGLLLSDITARTGSIALAWGIHFSNNVLALLVMTLPGPLSGLGLYRITVETRGTDVMAGMLIGNAISLVVIYALYLIWLRMRRPASGPFAIFG